MKVPGCLGHVTSHTNTLPLLHGIMDTPSGLLPSDFYSLVGSKWRNYNGWTIVFAITVSVHGHHQEVPHTFLTARCNLNNACLLDCFHPCTCICILIQIILYQCFSQVCYNIVIMHYTEINYVI